MKNDLYPLARALLIVIVVVVSLAERDHSPINKALSRRVIFIV